MQPILYLFLSVIAIICLWVVRLIYLYIRYPYSALFGMTMATNNRFEELCANLGTNRNKSLESAANLYHSLMHHREKGHRLSAQKDGVKKTFDPKLLGDLTLFIGPLRKQQFALVMLNGNKNVAGIIFDLQHRTGFHSPDSVTRCAFSTLEWIANKRLNGHRIIAESEDEIVDITEHIDRTIFPNGKLHLAHHKGEANDNQENSDLPFQGQQPSSATTQSKN